MAFDWVPLLEGYYFRYKTYLAFFSFLFMLSITLFWYLMLVFMRCYKERESRCCFKKNEDDDIDELSEETEENIDVNTIRVDRLQKQSSNVNRATAHSIGIYLTNSSSDDENEEQGFGGRELPPMNPKEEK